MARHLPVSPRVPEVCVRSFKSEDMQLIDLTGASFGRLTVVRRGEGVTRTGRRKRTSWVCSCACGVIVVAVSEHLLRGAVKSCGCIRRENSRRLGVENPPLSFRYEDPTIPAFNHVLHMYLANAAARGRPWELTREVALSLFSAPCHYCGRDPSNPTRKIGILYNGIDRVDNARGYTSDNVVAACSICNKAKGTMLYTDFVSWLNTLAAYRAGVGR